MSVEKVKARELVVGDRISLNGINKPAFVITEIEEDCRIMFVIKARRITVVNDAGLAISKLFGLVKPMRRESEAGTP